MYILSRNLKKHWFNYIWQSAAAGIFAAVLIFIFHDIVGLFILAGVGSTIFTIFALPNNRTAKIRNILGSYIISIIIGMIFFHLGSFYISGGLAIGISTFLMVITDTEHPPAAGIALGLAYANSSGIIYEGVCFALLGALISVALHQSLKPWLRDLF